MLAAVDVDYRADGAVAGCVLFHDWADAQPAEAWTVPIRAVEAYQPGQFYRRELPCLLEVLSHGKQSLDAVIVDGYVWLRHENEPGLGAHLFNHLGQNVAVVGVAKTWFQGAYGAQPVCRGASKRPLYVSSAGMTTEDASAAIRTMHGAYRLPTLLRQVDHMVRAWRTADSAGSGTAK